MKLHIYELWTLLTRSSQLMLMLLILLITFSTLTDLLVIGGVMPLVAIFTTSTFTGWMQEVWIFSGLSDKNSDYVKMYASFIYLILILAALLAKGLSTYTMYRFTHRVGTEFALKVFDCSMSVSYEHHLMRSSSNLISALTIKCNDVVQFYTSILQIVVSILNISLLCLLLISIDFALASSVTVFVGTAYALIYIWARVRLLKNGEIVAASSSKFIGVAREGLTGYRDVILEDLANSYKRSFEFNHNLYMKTLGVNSLIAYFPKLFFDLIVYLMLVLILNKMIPGGADYFSDLAKISAFALAIQRISPLAHVLYSSLSNLQGTNKSVSDVIHIIRRNEPNSRTLINFQDSIELVDVSYRYPGSNIDIISNLSLKINLGEWWVFVGKSGAGKSTLFDLILGLLVPTSGKILINDKNINCGEYILSNIGHVSQRVHLFEGSILYNITLQEIPCEDSITKAKECLEIVNLHLHVSNLPDELNYKIGEDGAGLSGGQRQRLGIARALFKCPSLLVLDEATSAIDEATADVLMSNIRTKFPSITCIRITHRLSELSKGERIFSLEEGLLKH